eukprot:scaffold7269_cov108-Skeletonema_dohrnii-CCMP3373.AAC.3
MIDHWVTRLTYISAKDALKRKLAACSLDHLVQAVHRSANLQICKFSWGMLKLEFIQAHVHEANLSTHDRTKPSCRGLKLIIYYLLKSSAS